MKYATLAASIILGLLFTMSSVVFLFNLVPMPEIPKDTPPYHFMAAFGPTGYMTFVKVFELLGGLFLLLPKTRNLGLLCIGPVLVNILAYHGFVMKGEGLLDPMLIVICLLALFLLWAERKAWAGLVK
ncbi:MAG: hypothetical protein B7Z37_27070 [Verrucomicrobia bacterium 12-59-8]|nr:MAG: hypothetical protein B7Z37_27070 [Verrucomicrobia bacterium 12-59-8]